jgi:histidinol phosphatase-like PHP family hydrolase
LKVDAHIHSTFSIDGQSSIGEMVESAIAKGFDAVCFTEHFDLNPLDSGTGGFDALAHADFPKRYLKEKVEPRADLLADMVAALVSKGIALELNSSPLRKGCKERYPSELILRAYLDSGGRAVTLGSDAHRGDDVGADFARLDVPSGCEPCLFRRRRKVSIGAAG